MQSNLGSQLLGKSRILPLQLTKLRPLAQFFTNEKFRVDQIDNQLGFGLKLRETSQVIAGSRLLTAPPTLPEIDPRDRGKLADRHRRPLRYERFDLRLLAGPPLPLKFKRRRVTRGRADSSFSGRTGRHKYTARERR